MEKIGLLIDSTTLTRNDLLDYDFIKVAQLQVQIDDKTYKEKDLSKEQMEAYVEAGKKFLTSQPAPSDFLELYKEYYDEGYTRVIAIVLSHKLSGTYQSAMVAKSMMDFDLQVDVHSSIVASYGLALGVSKLAELIKKGKSYEEITNKYNKLLEEPLVSFTLGDLKNLFRGGRLNRVQAFVGKILRIKPVIEMINGKLELVKKERSNAGCNKHFMEKIDYYYKKYKKVYLDVISINMNELSNQLIEKVKEKYNEIEIHITNYLSPVFYSHLGNKGFGIAVMAE
ncbi:DegV family protein [Candidatus Izemoplasma sp. B36]|uniref:DegV family protein n=1 Tax=Candidatus Izemoplasma sp. B36 TaxID=3242468 RepID=UPI003558FDAE